MPEVLNQLSPNVPTATAPDRPPPASPPDVIQAPRPRTIPIAVTAPMNPAIAAAAAAAVEKLRTIVHKAASFALSEEEGLKQYTGPVQQLAALVTTRNEAAARVIALPKEIALATQGTDVLELLKLRAEAVAAEQQRDAARELVQAAQGKLQAFRGLGEDTGNRGAQQALNAIAKRLEKERQQLEGEILTAVAPYLERLAVLNAESDAAVGDRDQLVLTATSLALRAVVPVLAAEPKAPEAKPEPFAGGHGNYYDALSQGPPRDKAPASKFAESRKDTYYGVNDPRNGT